MMDINFFLEVGGKVVHSLEELEARMRGGAPPPATSTDAPRVNKTEEDLSAFKKLVNLIYNNLTLFYFTREREREDMSKQAISFFSLLK